MTETPITAGDVRPLVVGANHRSSSLALRDRLFVEDETVPAFLDRLKAAGIAEALVLSTCDRVEVQALLGEDGPTEAAAIAAIRTALAEHGEVPPAEIEGQVYGLAGREALRHIFAVASSLDSMMIGETQVLGQVRDGVRRARLSGHVGAAFDRVMQGAVTAAKRIRAETTIGTRPVSISSAAVRVARDLFGELEGCSALLVGVGDMGLTIVEDLRAAGLDRLSVTHRTAVRAERSARDLGSHVLPFSALDAALKDADIVLAAMGTREPVITAAMVDRALTSRRARPQFLIDAAVPGDIETAVADLDDAFLYGLGDLERIAMEGRALRAGEAEKAATILEEEVDRFIAGRAERAAVPVLVDLGRHFEAIRDQALKDAGGDAEKAVRLFMKRALHAPFGTLKARAAAGEDFAAMERALRDLFDLKPKDDDAD